MNAKIKFYFSIIFVFYYMISLSYSVGFNACSVNFNQPWLDVKDNVTLDDVLIIDNLGNTYFRGSDHNLNNFNSQNSFKVGSAYFNKITSKFTSFNPNQINLPTNPSLIVKNNLGQDVTKMDKLGNIFTKGKGVFQGSQAGCAPDGPFCNGAILENRNNFCSILGNKVGACTFNVLSSENCLTKLSTDTDGGINYPLKGSIKDYIGCSSGACTSNTYTDFCNGNILTEYANLGSSFSTNTKDCTIDNYQYCTNGQIWTTTNTCGTGACSQGTDSLVQNCAVTATQYSTWTCSDINTKVQSITSYSPTCAGPSTCSQTASTSTQAVSCGTGNYCSAGNCNSLSYSWKTNAFSGCSVTCGGGTKSRTVWCEDNLGTTVTDSFCNLATKPVISQTCNTQACAVFSWSVGNYNGCSVTCGGGTQTRSVVCKNQYGITFADSNCNLATKPVVSQTCNTQACAVFSWSVGNYGTCINGLYKLRTVLCKNNLGTTVADSFCTTPKPLIYLGCVTYSWQIISTSACLKVCGPGTKLNHYGCKDSIGMVDYSGASCTGSKPADTSVSCNNGACGVWVVYDPHSLLTNGIDCNTLIGKYCGLSSPSMTSYCTQFGWPSFNNVNKGIVCQ